MKEPVGRKVRSKSSQVVQLPILHRALLPELFSTLCADRTIDNECVLPAYTFGFRIF